MIVPSLTQQDIDLMRDDTPGVRQLIHFNNAGTGLAPTPDGADQSGQTFTSFWPSQTPYSASTRAEVGRAFGQ